MAKVIITDTIGDFGSDLLSGSVDNAIKFLEALKAKHGPNLYLHVNSNNDGLEDFYSNIDVVRQREETDNERKARLRARRKQKKAT